MLPNCCFHIGIKSESWKFLNGILNFDSECTNSFTLQPKKAKKCFKKVNCKHPILSSEYALLTKRVWSKWLDTGRIRLCIFMSSSKKMRKKKRGGYSPAILTEQAWSRKDFSSRNQSRERKQTLFSTIKPRGVYTFFILTVFCRFLCLNC